MKYEDANQLKYGWRREMDIAELLADHRYKDSKFSPNCSLYGMAP